MIPKQMEKFLRAQLPERTWQNRLVRENGKCFMEFYPMDIDRLSRLGIVPDSLGPKLVACIWDEQPGIEIGGYLVVDNLAMGRPSMGGIRVLPDLKPNDIRNLARGMTLKNAAANLPYGGGKAGLLSDPSTPPHLHAEIVRKFARLLYRYRDIYIPGPDVGTDDSDMKIIAIENGLDSALSKPMEMGGNHINQFGAAGGGLAIALQALLLELPRLKVLPQFTNVQVPQLDEITVMIQGFGAVGSHTARILQAELRGLRVVGISDSAGYLFNTDGLPIDLLFQLRQKGGSITRAFYREYLDCAPISKEQGIKFANCNDDLLRESAFCLIPAAPVSNYLDLDASFTPSMTVDRMGRWMMIIEGANTYSPDENRKNSRSRMEREVYRQRGILIAPDYLVNSGGVIFAAQEHLIKTPPHLRIPDNMLGSKEDVEIWLDKYREDLQALAEKRSAAAEVARNDVIRKNMHELVDLLISDADMLPGEAAEQISLRRIASREKGRHAVDIMERIITIPSSRSLEEAAGLLIETGCPLLAVVNEQEELQGVITDWDITRAAALGQMGTATVESAMTRQVISARPDDSILELVHKLDYYEISAMPIVEGKSVLGMISADILARRSLVRLLQAQSENGS